MPDHHHAEVNGLVAVWVNMASAALITTSHICHCIAETKSYDLLSELDAVKQQATGDCGSSIGIALRYQMAEML